MVVATLLSLDCEDRYDAIRGAKVDQFVDTFNEVKAYAHHKPPLRVFLEITELLPERDTFSRISKIQEAGLTPAPPSVIVPKELLKLVEDTVPHRLWLKDINIAQTLHSDRIQNVLSRSLSTLQLRRVAQRRLRKNTITRAK